MNLAQRVKFMLKQILKKCEELALEFAEDFRDNLPQKELKQKILEEVQDELEYPILAHLSAQEQLQLVREYNKLENPTTFENLVISALNTDNLHNQKRKFTNDESAEVMAAYSKCASAINKDMPMFKHNLAQNIKSLFCAHPETAGKALKIYDEHFSDIDIIDNVRSCMTSNPRLVDKGFAVIHKNVNNLVLKRGESKEAKFMLSERLATAFRDLYGYYGSQSSDNVDKITENFVLLEKYIERKSQIDIQHTLLQCDSPDRLCQVKNEMLYDSFKKMEEDGRTFGEIYAGELAENKEKLEQLDFTSRVSVKIRKKSNAEEKDAAIMPNSLKYNLIHAGPEKPDEEKFKCVTNARYNMYREIKYDKPSGGLWSSLASKNDDNVGQWMEFCQRDYTAWIERKYKGSWHIVPNDDCRILEFHKLSDIRPYLFDIKHPKRQCSNEEVWDGLAEFAKTGKRRICVDYAAIAKDYDLFIIENQFPNHPLFGDLDCDSGLIMDIKKVTVKDNEEYSKFIEKEVERFGERLRGSDVDISTLKRAGDIKRNKHVMKAKFISLAKTKTTEK